MIIGRFFPALCSMTRVTCLIFKLSLVRVLVAVRGVACFGIKRFITILDMALFTLCVYMLAIQLEPFILLGGMIKERRLPALGIVACVALLILKLIFVRVLVTEGAVACLERYILQLLVLVTLLASYLLMLICKRVFCLGVVDLYLLPSIGSMAVGAYRLSFMRVFVACDALFVLLDLELVFRMTLRALD